MSGDICISHKRGEDLDLDPDPLDPQDFSFLDPDLDPKYPDSRGKISTKNCKTNELLKKIPDF